MSKKRSRRNTKSFKKARARAGIPRQDLRSGGRVSLMEGSVTIGQDDDDEVTTSKDDNKTTTSATSTDEIDSDNVVISEDMQSGNFKQTEAAKVSVPKDYSSNIAKYTKQMEDLVKKMDKDKANMKASGRKLGRSYLRRNLKKKGFIRKKLKEYEKKQQAYTDYQAAEEARKAEEAKKAA